MAPEKTVDKTSSAKQPPEKQRRKPKIEKPKLRTPSVIKVKLSSKKLEVSAKTSTALKTKPVRSTKKSAAANIDILTRKIDLANEVARAQLVKPIQGKVPVVEQSVKPVAKKAEKKLPGRKRKVTETANTTADSTKASPKKKTSYNCQAKRLKPIRNAADTNTISKRKADSTSKKSVKRANTPKNCQVTPKPKTTKRVYCRKGKTNAVDNATPTKQQKDELNEMPIMNGNVSHAAPEENIVPAMISPIPIDSRKNSLASNSECLSWTKDISSSSTNTLVTVCSKDIVRIDKKLPLVKLHNIGEVPKPVDDNKKIESDSSDSESTGSSDSSGCSSSTSSSCSSRISINLSSSSAMSTKSHEDFPPERRDSSKDIESKYMLDKLNSKLKKIDLEFISWLRYDDDNLTQKQIDDQDRILKILKDECEVIEMCENITKVLKGGDAKEENVAKEIEKASNKIDNEVNFIVPLTEGNLKIFSDRSEDDGFISDKGRNSMFSQTCRTSEDNFNQVDETFDDENNYISDKKNLSFEQNYTNDDGDTISLFAESITGIESSKLNSSAASICAGPSDSEEYVPEPISKETKVGGFMYEPTKIDSQSASVPNKAKIVCEKQNADSTSIYRSEQEPLKLLGNVAHSSTPNCVSNNTAIFNLLNVPVVAKNKIPKFMASIYNPANAVKSIVFKGVCFFNLISNCKKTRCLFPHITLDIVEVRNRLVRLSEELFIREYMLMRNWPELRHLYGLCYIEDCYRRELTRILLEMTIDFTSKARNDCPEDVALKTNALEYALMHLNGVDLKMCDDFLQFVIGSELLCDIFMRTIAVTQNFSRFKSVFINLTDYMVNINKSFNVDVANQILERVSILPSELALSKAVLKMIYNTVSSIFNNPMMRQFEKQLAGLDMDLYKSFLVYKDQVPIEQVTKDVDVSSPINNAMLEQSIVYLNRESRFTSPDTTKIDCVQKPPEEIIRTVDFRQVTLNVNSNASSISNDSQEYRPPPKKTKFYNWRPNNVFHPPMRHQGLRPQMRPARQVTYGLSPSKFRRPGLDYGKF